MWKNIIGFLPRFTGQLRSAVKITIAKNDKKTDTNKKLLENYINQKAEIEQQIKQKEEVLDSLTKILAEYKIDETSPLSKLIKKFKKKYNKSRNKKTYNRRTRRSSR